MRASTWFTLGESVDGPLLYKVGVWLEHDRGDKLPTYLYGKNGLILTLNGKIWFRLK